MLSNDKPMPGFNIIFSIIFSISFSVSFSVIQNNGRLI